MVIQEIPSFDPNPSLRMALALLEEAGIENYALIGRVATWVFLPTDRQQFTKDDQDAKSLLRVEGLDYEHLRPLVKRHLGTGTANRLDVFAREVGLLPPRATYKTEISDL